MYEETYPPKRKNDDYREPLLAPLGRVLGRLIQGCFQVLIVKPLRWAWQVTLWSLRWTWRATVWAIKAPFRWTGWLLRELWALSFGRMPELETAREREIWRRVRRRYRRRNFFMTHIFAFALIIGGMWIQYLSLTWRSYATPYLFVTLIWAFFLLYHFVRYRLAEAEDTALEAALEREYERAARSQPLYYEEIEKYYGDQYRRLSDEPPLEARLPKAKRRRS